MYKSSHSKLLEIVLIVFGIPACASTAHSSANNLIFHDYPLQIPIADPAGHVYNLRGHLCVPTNALSLPRIVVINHGSPPSKTDRPKLKLAECNSEAVEWFLKRHYAVAQVARLGYGVTGGPWSESYNRCEDADFYRAGLDTAKQIKVTVDYLITREDLNPNGVIVVGQSAGGWGTLAYDSIPHSHVSAFINISGGRGGHYHNISGSNCHPDRLISAAAQFGKTARTPSLWIYTQNDSFFNPTLAQAMFRAFTQAGGNGQLVATSAYGKDGHHVFFGQGGADIWGPEVETFLRAAQ